MGKKKAIGKIKKPEFYFLQSQEDERTHPCSKRHDKKKKPTIKPKAQKLWPVNMHLTEWKRTQQRNPSSVSVSKITCTTVKWRRFYFSEEEAEAEKFSNLPKVMPNIHIKFKTTVQLVSISFFVAGFNSKQICVYFFGPDTKFKSLIKCFSIHKGEYQKSIKIYFVFIMEHYCNSRIACC